MSHRVVFIGGPKHGTHYIMGSLLPLYEVPLPPDLSEVAFHPAHSEPIDFVTRTCTYRLEWAIIFGTRIPVYVPAELDPDAGRESIGRYMLEAFMAYDPNAEKS